MSVPYVYAGTGAQSAESLQVTITPEVGTPLDLTTVTACTLQVRKGSGAEAIWDTVITSQTLGGLVVVHQFEELDVPSETTLTIMPILTVPGGERRCEPFTLIVRR